MELSDDESAIRAPAHPKVAPAKREIADDTVGIGRKKAKLLESISLQADSNKKLLANAIADGTKSKERLVSQLVAMEERKLALFSDIATAQFLKYADTQSRDQLTEMFLDKQRSKYQQEQLREQVESAELRVRLLRAQQNLADLDASTSPEPLLTAEQAANLAATDDQ
jgi:hypothetical protein